MKYKVVVRPEAEAELAEAFIWYEQQYSGLGNQFLLAIDAAINSILRNPQMYPVVHGAIRRMLTRRFPYQIFYIIEGAQIVVIAVFHGMRNPHRWQERIES
jgi:toxin ParE1/3/4